MATARALAPLGALAALPLMFGTASATQPGSPVAPLAANHVEITDRLHTSGQPDATSLSSLAQRGFQLVVNLAPPSNKGAVPEEGKLVAENGPAYVNIPVDWRKPTYEDFALFSAVMNAASGRKTLVHCQLNYRASAFAFLHRVVNERVAPEQALAAMQLVWTPRDHWADFVHAVLERHGIAYRLPPVPAAERRESTPASAPPAGATSASSATR